MLRVGLSGGIGSGKSTVVAMLRQSGLPVIEADALAHELIRPGQAAYDEILRNFGSEILQENGEIHRTRLAAIVFSSPEKLDRLNRIVHPRVIERAEKWLAERAREGTTIAIVEAPLLVETGFHRRLDRLVVVWCRSEQQIERLVHRGMNQEEAERRIGTQMAVEEKRRLADDLIDNSGTIEETRSQVEDLARRLASQAHSAQEAIQEE